jgi:hypothetical protein
VWVCVCVCVCFNSLFLLAVFIFLFSKCTAVTLEEVRFAGRLISFVP